VSGGRRKPADRSKLSSSRGGLLLRCCVPVSCQLLRVPPLLSGWCGAGALSRGMFFVMKNKAGLLVRFCQLVGLVVILAVGLAELVVGLSTWAFRPLRGHHAE